MGTTNNPVKLLLNELYAHVLSNMSDEYYYGNRTLCSHTELPDHLLKGVLKELRLLGYVEYIRGGFTDDGEVAGSGNVMTSLGKRWLNEYTNSKTTIS